MSVEVIKVPDLGGAEGVEVIEICVAVGDSVAQEDSLIVLESDKASMEVPSPQAGVVKAISIAVGDSLSVGDVILELEVAGVATDEASVEAKQEESVVTKEQPEIAPVAEADNADADVGAGSPGSTVEEQINIPDLGGSDNVDVIEVCVSVGDELAEGDSLIVLETDKASMEVPSPKAGKVIALAVKEGDVVSEGAAILTLEVTGGGHAVAEAKPTASKPTSSEPPVQAGPDVEDAEEVGHLSSSDSSEIPTPAFAKSAISDSTASDAKSPRNFYAGPAVRMLARELGVELAEISGTGPRQRITKDDLKSYVKKALQAKAKPAVGSSAGGSIEPIPAVDFSQFGEVTIEPLSKIAKVTAHNMQRSWLNVPHVTQFDDADITDLEDFRATLKVEGEKRGVKVTPLPFLLKACAKALQEHPKFNASLHHDGESTVYKHYVHIGMAVDTPAGLMVPVIRDVDKKSIWDLAAETVELAGKAKDRKLKPAEMQGGCFTISSLGAIGGQGFTPIVNAPEVGILAVSKLAVKPQWSGEEFVPRKMLPLSLSYDHRAINGGDAGRFMTYLVEVLSDIRKLVL